jgi:high-affinity nickel-transport protein
MVVLGMRHALEVDHITAIDNLVRLHNASKRARLVGTGFSTGHMISVLAEMVFIIYVIGSATSANSLAFWGGIIGAGGIGTIGAINIYAMKRWGKTGAAILASKILSRTGMLGPFGSALITGMVFGLGFDTATQISAITLSAVASATLGIQMALVLTGAFAVGMIPIDTLDSFVLRSAFAKIFTTRGFRYLSYALSGAALSIAAIVSYSILADVDIIPQWLGPALAVGIIAASFGYGYITRGRRITVVNPAANGADADHSSSSPPLHHHHLHTHSLPADDVIENTSHSHHSELHDKDEKSGSDSMPQAS